MMLISIGYHTHCPSVRPNDLKCPKDHRLSGRNIIIKYDYNYGGMIDYVKIYFDFEILHNGSLISSDSKWKSQL